MIEQNPQLPLSNLAPIIDQDQDFWTPENQLNEMRSWRRSHNEVFRKCNIPDEYWEAEQHLEQIYHIYQAEPENNPNTLLYSFIRYLEATDRGQNIDLDFHFLNRLCSVYLEDVDTFKEAGFRYAPNIAVYHSADDFQRLQDNYIDHDFIKGDDIKKAFGAGVSDPTIYLQDLESYVLSFKKDFEPEIRQKYNFPGNWTLSFIKSLLLRNSNPYKVADDIIRTATGLKDKYHYAKDPTLEGWGKHIVTNQPPDKARITKRLLEDIPTGIDPSPELLNKARIDLQNLRLALPEGLGDSSNTKSVDVQRLAMVFKLNWHESFEGLNLLDEARHFHYTTLRYNKMLDRQSQLHISTDPENLYSIFRVFAQDVIALRSEGPERVASHVAKYHPPGVYEEYKHKYSGRHHLLTNQVIIYHIINTPRDIDTAIKKWIARVDSSPQAIGFLAIEDRHNSD